MTSILPTDDPGVFLNTTLYPDYVTACNSTCSNASLGDVPRGRPSDSHALEVLLLSIYGIIAAVGLVGNGLVIFVIIKYTKMKTVTNMYILNLSIADGLFLIGLPMVMTTVVLKSWIFGLVLCKLYYILTCINMFTGTFTLTAMSLDRFLAVCHPVTSITLRTPKYAIVAIVLTWIISFVFMLPVVLYSETVARGPGSTAYTCSITWPTQYGIPGQNIFVTYNLLLGFVIPVVVISLLYALLVIRLRTTGTQANSVRRRQSHRKVTKLVTLIIVIFIVCWMPYWVFQVFLIAWPPTARLKSWLVNIYQGFTCLSYSNSMVNPLLYAFTNENFREAFISAFKCVADPFHAPNKRMGEWESVNPNENTKVINQTTAQSPTKYTSLNSQNGNTMITAAVETTKLTNGEQVLHIATTDGADTADVSV